MTSPSNTPEETLSKNVEERPSSQWLSRKMIVYRRWSVSSLRVKVYFHRAPKASKSPQSSA
jgi:hypothetical protein